MRISDWSSDVCSSDLAFSVAGAAGQNPAIGEHQRHCAEPGGDIVAPALADRPAEHLGDHAAEHRADDGDQDRDGETARIAAGHQQRSEEHTSELQSLMSISYAVLCLKNKKINNAITHIY